MFEISQADWKLCRERIPKWQERYMERLNKKYAKILTSSNKASENFWKVEKLINKDKRHPGVIIEMRRSTVVMNVARFYWEGIITRTDLDGFSEEFVDVITGHIKAVSGD